MRFTLGKAFNIEDETPSGRARKYELWRGKWKCILPLYHFMECPQCGAICVDGQAVYRHRNGHFERDKLDKEIAEQINGISAALEFICDRIGISYAYDSPEYDDNETGESDGYVIY